MQRASITIKARIQFQTSKGKATLLEPPGSVERIRLLRVVGEGEGSRVAVGVDSVLQRRVVMKSVGRDAGSSARHSLVDEARKLSQLDHPNIVRIHRYEEQGDVDEFIVELAEGKNLREVQGLEWRRKLEIAQTVANVLATVHRAGVVHGALTPESVFLTDIGEIKITDFAVTRQKLDTGTADGEPPAPPDDVLAFGRLLEVLFADRAGDRDLRELIASMTVPAAADRPTAASVLTSLQRLARRGARRFWIAAVGVAAVLVILGVTKYTLDLRAARTAALASKAEAESRRAEANELVGFMLGDLTTKLEGVGKLDALDATTVRALAHFASMKPEEMSTAEMNSNANAVRQLGQIRLTQGEFDEAVATFEKSLALAETAQRRAPDDLEVAFTIGRAHSWIGNTRQQEGKIPEALTHMRLFARSADALAAKQPNEIKYLKEQSYAHSNIGTLLERQLDVAGALAEYETALAIKRRVLAKTPTDEMKADVAVTMNKAGAALQILGRYDAARQRFDEERQILEQVLKGDPNQRRWRQRLAVCHDYLGNIALAQGDLEAAERHFATQVAINSELVAFDKANIDWTRNLAVGRRQLGSILRMRGDVAGALREQDAATRLIETVITAGKPRPWQLRDMALIHADYGRSLLAAKRTREALTATQRAVSILAEMKSEPARERTYATALIALGDVQAAAGRPEDARKTWQQALTIAEPLPAKSTDPRTSDVLVRALLRMGDVQRAAPIAAKLRQGHYKNPELESLCREKGLV